jgi:hypothetical protein
VQIILVSPNGAENPFQRSHEMSRVFRRTHPPRRFSRLLTMGDQKVNNSRTVIRIRLSTFNLQLSTFDFQRSAHVRTGGHRIGSA